MRQFRVIQGGKKGQSSAHKPRLYKAYSVSDLLRGEIVYHDVHFSWYYQERREPPFVYSDVIADYDKLEDRQKRFLERSIDRYFVDEEIRELREYLSQKYGMQLLTEDVDLPIKNRGAFFEEGSSVIYDFLELSEKPGYPLLFKVWGYYTLSQCITSPSLENGVQFLLKAFELLGPHSALRREDIEAVVKRLYSDEKLVVKNRSTDGDCAI